MLEQDQDHIGLIQTPIEEAIETNDLNLLTQLIIKDPTTVLTKTFTMEDGVVLNIAMYLALRLHNIPSTIPELLILLLQQGADLRLQDSTKHTLLDSIFFLQREKYSNLRDEAFFCAQQLLEECITPKDSILIFNNEQAEPLVATLSNQPLLTSSPPLKRR